MENFEAIVESLKNGGTILYPTDTIWGLGCDASNEEACQKILQLKNRPEEKSFIILVDSIQMLEKYVPEFPDVCYDLIELATRPLTIIYPTAKNLAPSVFAKDGTIGIRVTSDKNCISLIRALKKPIVSTSANVSGEKSPSCFAEINESLKQNVDHVVREKLEEIKTTPSQIIKIGLNSSIEIIRK